MGREVVKMLLRYILLFLLLSYCSALFLDDTSTGEEDAGSSASSSREGRFLSGNAFSKLFGLFGGSGTRCGHPERCPVHHCRFDPAVIHGFCCGCAHPTDRVPITCPGNLQCPLYGHKLCNDYDYMMDCCC